MIIYPGDNISSDRKQEMMTTNLKLKMNTENNIPRIKVNVYKLQDNNAG